MDGHPHDCGIPVEALTPQPVADYGDVVVAALVLDFEKTPSERRMQAEQWQQSATRQRGPDFL